MKKEPTYYDLVYEVVKMVPFGKVTTYGVIADYLSLGSARMVGWALNQSFSSETGVPAHRVVNRKGELSGRNHFATPTLMQQLLENEGLIIEDHRIKDFASFLWKPDDY